MEVFRGEIKEERAAARFTEKTLVTKNRLTKIPDRVTEINAFPTVLKEGAVPVTEKNAESAFKEFLRENREVFEVEPDDLKMDSVRKIKDRWYVKYRQYYKGIPVYNATVGLDSSENGRVSSYASNYQPDIRVSTEPAVSLNKAVYLAKETYPAENSQKLQEKESMLIIYPEQSEDRVLYHLAWKFMIAGEQPDPETDKVFIIDAADGTIIQSWDARFPDATVTGDVQGEVYPVNPTDAVNSLAVRDEYVDIDYAGKTVTNDSGHFSVSVPWYWPMLFFFTKHARFTLDGPHARVQNSDGSSYTETRNCDTDHPCNLTWTATDRDHINVFYHMNLYHDWLKDELGYSWVNHDGTGRFNARVNYSFSNAYAGNPMQFGTSAYARSSDVIYHECTHNILHHEYGDYIGYPARYIEAYAMDEGFSDYFSNSFTNDSVHGEGCSANPRDHNNTVQYPGKAAYNDEGHTGGMIIGGAAWDLRQRLIDSEGAAGARIADKLILEAHQILSNYPRNYYFSDPHESNFLHALYKAADTNNNLLDGFPYFNDIQMAFHNHDLLQAVLEDGDSYDFSTNVVGNYTGGDMYYSGGKFWANNAYQQGVAAIGNVPGADLAAVAIPTSGFTRFGVPAITGHTYMAQAQEGETGGYIAFQVISMSADKSEITIRYLYRYSPHLHVANLNSLEIHKPDCHWVSLMADDNKRYCADLAEVAKLIKDEGYNGCHYCLPRYDADSLTIAQVHINLDEDL